MEESYNKLKALLIYVVLALATFIAYEQVRNHDFISYDDDKYVCENRHVMDGLTSDSIRWAFTTDHAGYWHPLTWLSHMLDCQLFGTNPGWHHVTNVLFHIANTLLLFAVLKRMTGAFWCSVFVASAFALHPLHVESVAWIAERKDVLSGFFWMLTIWAYVRYAERPGINRYVLVLLSFALGLMAKPMLVTLPFVLLLLDYWPLGRVQWASEGTEKNLIATKSAGLNRNVLSAIRLTVEKIPLFVLSAASSIVTCIGARSSGAMTALEWFPLKFRIANASLSYRDYIVKMFYPSRLAVLYPYQEVFHIGGAVLLLVGISVLVIRQAQRRPWLTVGWLWYLGTLVPVIGLVRVGSQAMADRYTYLPSIGIFIMVSWGATELLAKWRYQKIGLGILAGLLLTALLICTYVQVRYWRNDFTLYEHTLSVTRKNYVIHFNYGVALLEKGRLDEAVIQFRRALQIKPNNPKVHYSIGYTLALQGKLKEAVSEYRKFLQIIPDDPDVHNNLGVVLTRQGKYNEAINHFNEALQAKPDWPEVLDSLSVAYAAAGNFPEAVKTAEKAIKLAEAADEEDMAQGIQKRLELYKAGQPYHEE